MIKNRQEYLEEQCWRRYTKIGKGYKVTAIRQHGSIRRIHKLIKRTRIKIKGKGLNRYLTKEIADWPINIQ